MKTVRLMPRDPKEPEHVMAPEDVPEDAAIFRNGLLQVENESYVRNGQHLMFRNAYNADIIQAMY